MELENGVIIEESEKHPPLIYDPFAYGTNWILARITDLIIDTITPIEKIDSETVKVFSIFCFFTTRIGIDPVNL